MVFYQYSNPNNRKGSHPNIQIVGSQLWEVKSAPTLGREVQSQQENWKFVGAQQFSPTMGMEGVLLKDQVTILLGEGTNI